MIEIQARLRGVWMNKAEIFCMRRLAAQSHDNIKFSDIVKAMQLVATRRDGYTHRQTEDDALALCHQMGFLHTEPWVGPDQKRITYLFASPIHQRYITTIRKVMMMLIVILELRTGASYQVLIQTQHQMSARSCRYA